MLAAGTDRAALKIGKSVLSAAVPVVGDAAAAPDHLSVCHLSKAYGKDVPETAKEIYKACRPKSIGMFCL